MFATARAVRSELVNRTSARYISAFAFPGQGVQTIDMLAPLHKEFPLIVNEVLEEADSCLSIDFGSPLGSRDLPRFSRLLFGPDATDADREHFQRLIGLTEYAQPAILTVGYTIMRILRSFGTDIKPDFMLGHSLGEFTALAAAGVLPFSDALWLVRQRGLSMQKSADAFSELCCATAKKDATLGMESIILGGSDDFNATLAALTEFCRSSGTPSRQAELRDVYGFTPVVAVANINSPRQIVLSGTRKLIAEAVETASAAVGRSRPWKRIPLNVSCPFHSPVLEPTKGHLRALLSGQETDCFGYKPRPIRLEWPPVAAECVVSNLTAKPFESREDVAQNLVDATVEPVDWYRSVQYVAQEAQQVRFYALGPGTVGARLTAQTVGNTRVESVTTGEEIIRVAEQLGGNPQSQ